VRVKLLEAFAAGLPVVSTPLGAEGLTETKAAIAALAEGAQPFAERVLHLLENPKDAQKMARAARLEVEANWDSATITRSLHEHYADVVSRKRMAANSALDLSDTLLECHITKVLGSHGTFGELTLDSLGAMITGPAIGGTAVGRAQRLGPSHAAISHQKPHPPAFCSNAFLRSGFWTRFVLDAQAIRGRRTG
jgi:hypothetical protein